MQAGLKGGSFQGLSNDFLVVSDMLAAETMSMKVTGDIQGNLAAAVNCQAKRKCRLLPSPDALAFLRSLTSAKLLAHRQPRAALASCT